MKIVKPVLSREASMATTRDAIERGELGLQTARSASAIAAARRVANRGRDFTTDDIWEELGWKPIGHDEASFMGSVMRYLSQEDEIKKTGSIRRSIRPEQHRKELRVWHQSRGKPMTDTAIFNVSQSKVSQWRRCKLAFHFQHREHLRPKVKSRPLYFGSTVHTMLEALAEGKDPRSALAEIAHRDEKLFREERDYFAKLIEDINFIFRAYKKFWAHAPLVFVPIGNRHAEVPFAVKIDDAIEVKGTIDGIVTHKSFNWLLENKTHAEFPNADHRWRNLQGAVYNSISRLLGWPKLQGLCWNYVRSKEPTRPKLLKTGKISIAKDCDTLPEVVLEVLEEHKLNPADYADFIAAQEANLPTWFDRIYQPVQEHVVKVLWKEFLATSREMADYYARTSAPPPRTIDLHCKWCQYEKLCRAELQGLDVDGVKQLDYVFDDTPYQRGQAA